MQKMIHGLVIAWMCFAGVAAAADRPVTGKAPDWVQPAPAEIQPGADTEAAVQVLLDDQQVRFSPTATETYIDERLRIQKPQGLQAIGTISISWQPDADVVTVHRLIVRRGAQVRDLLGTGEGFTILRREDLLEQATLTGMLTAVLQPTDLQVGDILEFAYTRHHADPVVPDKPDLNFGWRNAPMQNVRFRASWPKQMAIRWQLRDFKPTLQETTAGAEQSIAFTLDNPAPLLQPIGAPARYAAVRRVELTAFQSWPEVSQRFAPLYANASRLGADSPLRAEIERIRKVSTDPKARAAAALRLVQEQIRYVLLAMNDGALVPATAEQTWQRRYGDCKAKTALLLALLRELDIQAEPVTVDTAGGDGIDRRLPAIGAFDHVLVRAQIGGKTYWLDGTRPADRDLDLLKTPNFGWGLPLVARGSELVRIRPEPLVEPMVEHDVNLDASGGVDNPARFQARAIFRGDTALAIKLSLDNAEATQRDQGMRGYWRETFDGVQITKVTSAFDEASATLTWSAEGTLKMDWTDDGFYEAGDMRLGFKPDFTRPEGTDIEAPYAVSFPVYSRNRLSVKLPTGGTAFTLSGQNIDQSLAGMEYKRSARIENASFIAESSSRALVPEISAKDAHAAEAGLREMYKNGLYIRKPQTPEPATPLPSVAELQSQASQPLATAGQYLQRARQMQARKLHELALADLTHAIDMDPKLASAYLNRGWTQEQLDQPDKALADYGKAHSLNPDDVETISYYGKLLVKQRRTREVIEMCTEALKRDDSTALRSLRADALASAGQIEEALIDLDSIWKSDPADVANYTKRFTALMMLRRPEAARQVAADAIAAHAGPADGVFIGVSLYDAMGDRDKARATLNDAIAKTPSAELYSLRATFASTPEGNLADLEQAIKLNPKFVPALQRVATLQFSQKKYPDLLQTLDLLDAAAPVTSESRSRRGEALAILGNTAGAQEAFSSARAMASSGEEFNTLCLSEATAAGSWLQDATKDCNTAAAKDPDSAFIIDSRGLILLKLERYEEAIATYNVAIARGKQLVTSLYGRGIAEVRLGKNKEGEADIANALHGDPDMEATFKSYGVQR